MTIVLFDFDQTLVFSRRGLDIADQEAQKVLLGYLNRISPKSRVTKAEFAEAYKIASHGAKNNYRYDRTLWWKSLLGDFVGEPMDSTFLVELARKYWRSVIRETLLFPETIPALRAIAEGSNVMMGIISDSDGLVGGKITRIRQFPEVESMMQVIVVAGENGLPAKPEKAAFLSALKQLKNRTDGQTFYVGDRFEVDVVGACAAEMIPLWLVHPWEYPLEPSQPNLKNPVTGLPITDVVRLRTLEQLPAAIRLIARQS